MSKHRVRGLPAMVLAGALGSLLAAGAAEAQDVTKTLGYREGVMKALSWHIGPIAGMAKGEMEFDSAALQHHADSMAALATMVHEAFPESSEGAEGSKAKPEIWTDPDTFTARVAGLEEQTAVLAARAPFLTKDTLGAALGAVGGACKACHDDFRMSN